MKPKTLMLPLAILSLIAVGAAVSIGFGYWENSTKGSDLITSREGILVGIPTSVDKNEFVLSYDPKSSSPNDSPHYGGVDGIRHKVVIPFDFDGCKTELDFTYAIDKSGKVTLYSEEATQQSSYDFVRIPKTNDYVLIFNDSLYRLDVMQEKITKLLHDSINGYNIMDTLKDRPGENNELIWASRPSFNAFGDKMLYLTGRNESRYETWILDLKSGEEKFVIEGSYQVLKWLDNDIIYVDEMYDVYKIDINSGSKELIKESVGEKIINDPYLAYSTSEGAINLLNLESLEELSVKIENSSATYFIQNAYDSDWILMLKNPDPNKLFFDLVLLNIKTFKAYYIEPNRNELIEDAVWIDGQNFLVNVYNQDEKIECTYTTNIANFGI